MILFKHSHDVADYLTEERKEKKAIGFVPTMGALHAGHVSLIRRSLKENGLTVCSIFVNPAQFNDPEDLKKYPRPIEEDIKILCQEGCDILFLPHEKEIYPNGITQLTTYDLGHLESFLEGASRPGHFSGVANVVDRFLQILNPDRMYLGQKDFQQVKVLERMLQTSDTHTQIVVCPIIREENGLALSSRNVRLTNEQRKNASGISRELFFIRDHFREYPLNDLRNEVIHRINSIPEAQVDYLECCDADTFQIIRDWRDAHQIAVVTAVKVGSVRLLDNILISVNNHREP